MPDPLRDVIPDTFRNNAEEWAHPASGILSEQIQEIRKIWSAGPGITNNLIIVPHAAPPFAIYTERRISFLTGESGAAWRLGDLHDDHAIPRVRFFRFCINSEPSFFHFTVSLFYFVRSLVLAEFYIAFVYHSFTAHMIHIIFETVYYWNFFFLKKTYTL